MIINLVNNSSSDIKWKRIDFPNGHRHIDLDFKGVGQLSTYVTIKTRIKTYDDIFVLKQVLDQCRQRDHTTHFNLWCTHLMVDRYDRPMHDYDSFDLKIVCEDIKSLGFNRISLIEPHSGISQAFLHPCEAIHPLDNSIAHCLNRYADSTCIVTPDLGAVKRTEQYLISKKLDVSIVHANKHRNLATGEIIGLEIMDPDELSERVVIYDDLCDGGRTFTELAAKLRSIKTEVHDNDIVKHITLLVPHGLFSKGTDVLLTPNKEGSYVDEIFTTNAYRDDLVETDNFHIISVI